MTFGEILRNFRKERGYTLDKLAELLGTTKQVLSNYENDKRSPKISTVSRFAALMGVPLEYFSDTSSAPAVPPSGSGMRTPQYQRLPILGNVACGVPIESPENYEGTIEVLSNVRADFVLEAKGESMLPRIHPGDVVLIRQQPDVNDGQIAVVMVDGETTLKHVYHHGNTITLSPENPAFSPMTYTDASEVQILGLAVGGYQSFI